MARPKAKIDLTELEKLCGMQCTDEEIAAFFGVNKRTIVRRRKVQKFNDIMETLAPREGCPSAEVCFDWPTPATSQLQSSCRRISWATETS